MRVQRQMREFLIRLVYCEMLGHNVAFGYIHAVKLAQSSKNMLEKRCGAAARRRTPFPSIAPALTVPLRLAERTRYDVDRLPRRVALSS